MVWDYCKNYRLTIVFPFFCNLFLCIIIKIVVYIKNGIFPKEQKKLYLNSLLNIYILFYNNSVDNILWGIIVKWNWSKCLRWYYTLFQWTLLTFKNSFVRPFFCEWILIDKIVVYFEILYYYLFTSYIPKKLFWYLLKKMYLFSMSLWVLFLILVFLCNNKMQYLYLMLFHFNIFELLLFIMLLIYFSVGYGWVGDYTRHSEQITCFWSFEHHYCKLNIY